MITEEERKKLLLNNTKVWLVDELLTIERRNTALTKELADMRAQVIEHANSLRFLVTKED